MNTVLELASINRDAWNVGMRRVDKILAEERSKGFKAVATGMYSDTLDIFVFKGKELVRVYESTNYAMEGYIQPERGERYRDNLLEWDDVEKVFVCSSEHNLITLGGKDYFEKHGIKVVVKGYQD